MRLSVKDAGLPFGAKNRQDQQCLSITNHDWLIRFIRDIHLHVSVIVLQALANASYLALFHGLLRGLLIEPRVFESAINPSSTKSNS